MRWQEGGGRAFCVLGGGRQGRAGLSLSVVGMRGRWWCLAAGNSIDEHHKTYETLLEDTAFHLPARLSNLAKHGAERTRL